VIRTLIRFRRTVVPYRFALAIGGLLVLVVAVTGVLAPWPLKIVVDNVLKHKALTGWSARVLGGGSSSDHLLVLALAAMFGIVVLGAAADYLSTVLLDGVGERITADLRGQVFAHLQRLSLAFHDTARAGDLTTRIIADVDYVQEMLVASLSVLVPNVTVLIGIIAVMFVVDVPFALLALSVAPVMFITVYSYTRRIKAASRVARRKESEVASLVSESLSSMRVVQTYTLEQLHFGQFLNRNEARRNAGLEVIENQARMSPIVDLISTAGTALVLWFGVHRVIGGSMSLGTLLVFQAYLSQLYKPMRNLSKLATVMSRGQASAERVSEVLNNDQWVEERADAITAGRLPGALELRNVSYGFISGQQILRDVSLTCSPGEMIALVGPTGAGKSTLAGLVPRLYDPWHGQVLIDGYDVRDLTLTSLRSQIAVVLQDSILFHGTIYENIAYGSDTATREQVLAAAEAAYVDEFVRGLADGYETLVSERGTTLSGGQRQRIAIARALVRDTPIVILDEPTSNLDAVSERYVMRAIENLMQGRTVLVIAHRLSTLRNASRIYVLQDGEVVEHGSHHQLMLKNGLYRSMYKAQLGDGEVVDITKSRDAATG